MAHISAVGRRSADRLRVGNRNQIEGKVVTEAGGGKDGDGKGSVSDVVSGDILKEG